MNYIAVTSRETHSLDAKMFLMVDCEIFMIGCLGISNLITLISATQYTTIMIFITSDC